MERERFIGEESSSSSLREQRNLKEKQRRMRLKDLYLTLSSHVSPTRTLPVPQLIDQATSYMIQLKENVDYLKAKKKTLTSGGHHSQMYFPPKLSFNSRDSTIEMNLIMHPNMKKVNLHELVNVFEEEGAQVVSAHLHNLDDKTTCTIVAKAMIYRIGIDPSRIQGRLRDIIS